MGNFLVGQKLIDSRIEYKQAMLRGQLALLLGAACFFYIILDQINGLFRYVPIYLFGIATAILTIYLNRINKARLSSFILLFFANVLIYLVADSSMIDSGVFFFFTVLAVTGMVLFYNDNINIGLAFVGLTLANGIIAYFNDKPFLDDVVLTGNIKDINFVVNYVLGVISVVLVVLFIIRRNNESESSLIDSKESLEKLAGELTVNNNALQKANDELDRFVYSASHDMRAPLSTLLGLIEVAKISNKPEEIPLYFDMMSNRIHDMEGFIRDVTDYSRNTRLEVQEVKIKLKEIIDELKETFAFLANEASVKIEIDVDENIEIETDPTRLKVVLNNVLANAIKYHDPRKENNFVRLNATIENGSCTINILDNGIGISEEYQDKIFEMFFRATENSKGSGLGLYIVKETLDKLNGNIKFKSNAVKGSNFTVTLPVKSRSKV